MIKNKPIGFYNLAKYVCLIVSKNLTLVSSDINQLPNNIEAEQAVIGSVLICNEIFDDTNSIISENNFMTLYIKKFILL